jgi:GGDEF domain-containing protein
MNTHADKTQENKNQSLANETSHKQNGSKSTFQFVDNRPEAIAQRKLQEITNNSPQAMQLRACQEMANNSPQAKQAAQLQTMADNHSSQQQQTIQKKENNTGLPDNLKIGMENLSGMSLDDVKVHRNSDKPAQLNAHAYAQGSEIHVASGQEKHLPHEAWHVVQQKQGRVQPTRQMKGKVNINDDVGLEKEADIMGAKAINMSSENSIQKKHIPFASNNLPYQLNKEKALWALGGAVVTGLGSYLLSMYNERQARLRQEEIIADFDTAIADAGYIDNAQVRENTFIRIALTQGIEADTAKDLFNESGAAVKDVVTGFDVAGDRKPSVKSAIEYLKNNEGATAFYVEVDIRNLGGLNSVLGHSGADELFREMTDASAVEANGLKSGKVKVASFRHGGDEFSFLVVAEDGSVNGGNVQSAMDDAARNILILTQSTRISKYNDAPDEPYKAENIIADIEHPKHKGEEAYYGTGVIYGIGQILGTDDNVNQSISTADLQVEAKKK